ncbi:hypothetical protein [Spiroplasma endosymbiont of Phycita roborella]|uniref:hypothetical protein n=1 Tax=Spiroplasma endosymbiont of Phycita roborella TaxID=3066311 RepID=UPI00313E7458
MRKLLRFILSLMVATPTSISLVACGGTVYPVHKKVEWQPFLGLFFGRHLFLITNWS